MLLTAKKTSLSSITLKIVDLARFITSIQWKSYSICESLAERYIAIDKIENIYNRIQVACM